MATPDLPPDGDTARPFVVPCATLSWSAPLRWLRLGWRDFRRAPGLSLLFGGVILAVSVLVSVLAWSLGRFALLALLLSGFVFVAPLLAVAIYAVSRSLLDGETPRLRGSLRVARRVLGQAGVFALVQLVVMLLWSRAGMMLTVFVPLHQGDTRALVEYLAIGSLVGSVFFTLQTIMSPSPATRLRLPPSTLMHITSLAPVLSATSSLVCI